MKNKYFVISVLTVLVQYYDYHLFGFMAAKISDYFFGHSDPTVKLLKTYFIMFIAMSAKPIGSVIFGKIGDIKGRSNSLALSLKGTAIASFIIFIIPSYETIGIISAFLLLLARMAICAFVSSGSDGVRLYIYEHIRKDRQCLGIGITSFFTFSGTFIASISAAYFSSQDLEWYEWKYSFLIGAILGLAVIMLMKFMDYQDVHKVQTDSQYNEYKNIPLLRVIKINWKLFLYSMMAIGAIGATNQFLIIFFGTYCFKVLAINEQHAMQSIISKGVVLIMFSCLLAGYIADKFNRLTIALLAASILSVLTYYQGSYIEQGQVSACIFWISSFVLPFLHMPAAAIIKEAIPKVIRYRLFSFSHAIGSIIISAPTAFLATLVYHHSEVKFAPFIYFIFILFLLSLGLCLLYKKEIK